MLLSLQHVSLAKNTHMKKDVTEVEEKHCVRSHKVFPVHHITSTSNRFEVPQFHFYSSLKESMLGIVARPRLQITYYVALESRLKAP